MIIIYFTLDYYKGGANYFFLPCMRPSRDRGIRMHAVSLSLVVIALIKLLSVPFSCALRSLRTIKYFQPIVCELFQTGSTIRLTGCTSF